ncbi:MAG: RHS repeat-associated core domain-containing protein [Planctomycetaceae bacterium]|jgi:RHS repeat-associated protein|nr:RHS repeat-associated core domain-containing protein [Planctomycetaceae bacterium]
MTNNPSDDRLLARTEQFYDERGRVWKTEQSIVDPATGNVTGKLAAKTWYDAAGRVVKQIGLGENHFTKNVYDSLGRVVKTYVALDSNESDYASATNVTNDTVFQQSEMTYDNVGNVILSSVVERKINMSVTGALTLSSARYQYVTAWFDSVGRQIATANYGTNGDVALTRPTSVPTRSDSVLVNETFYDSETGRANRTIDPAGKDHRTYFDALGRTTKTIANYVTGTPTIANPDQDVTVETTYHSSGQIATLTAKNPATGDQITRYVYGTSKNMIAPIIYRNDLLVAEIYPDSDDSENISQNILENGSDGIADRVEFAYNRANERIWRKDQNGTIRVYEFDNLGRLLHDRVTTLGSNVDGLVRRISTVYNIVGQIEKITSYDNATIGSGNAVNEVKYEYDTNGLLAKELQNPSGNVESSSLYVGYTYDATKSGDYFTKRLRPTSLRYPGNTTINYVYGAVNSVDDKLNRFTAVKNGSTTVVEYTDSGVATPAKVVYPQPGLELDYTASGALDRFNRIADHAWKNASGNDIVRIKHGYDRVGNRLYREDVAATNAGKSFDELYSYDGVNQLIDMQRGTLGANKTSIVSQYKNWEEQFAFDATGNFANYKQDSTGDGTFELNQSRTHSQANEILTIGGSSSNILSDKNGAMTKCVKPDNWSSNYNLTYDAWNRLVGVKDSNNSTKIADYQYNGLNHRVVKKTYASGTLSETRLFYFNQNWQCLEEYVDSTCNMRYIWGLRYIDDLVMYRNGSTDYYSVADPNWNVVALINTSGVVQERYTYSSFGKLNVFDSSFTPKSTSSLGLTRSFTGQVLDAETGLMLYRNRVYHPTLGRFLQRDPIGYEGRDINLYRYIKNKPNMLIDANGLKAPSFWNDYWRFFWENYECSKAVKEVAIIIQKYTMDLDALPDVFPKHDSNPFQHCVWNCRMVRRWSIIDPTFADEIAKNLSERKEQIDDATCDLRDRLINAGCYDKLPQQIKNHLQGACESARQPADYQDNATGRDCGKKVFETCPPPNPSPIWTDQACEDCCKAAGIPNQGGGRDEGPDTARPYGPRKIQKLVFLKTVNT